MGGIEDEIEAVEEDEALFVEAAVAEDEPDEDFKAQHEIMESKVDALAWKTELERVGPRLRLSAKAAAGKEWRAHVELTKTSAENINKTMPETKTHLDTVASQLGDARETISRKENYINKQFEHKKDARVRRAGTSVLSASTHRGDAGTWRFLRRESRRRRGRDVAIPST